jgi:gluconolactonase
MRLKTVFLVLSGFSAPAFFLGPAFAQTPAAAQASMCMPTAEQAAQAFGARGLGTADRGQPAAQPAPRDLTITAIPSVVAAGGKWTKVWQEAGNSADGILANNDGSVLVAQEDYDTVLKIGANGQTSVAVADAKGVGSLSMDREGRLYGAYRTERPGSTKPDKASIVNAIAMLAPERKTIADKWADGTTLTVRPNDLAADSHGGAYFTVGCLYYASRQGVTVVGDNLRTNGIAFSPDDKTLYVTNGAALVAFDVEGPGMLTNRRDFAKLLPGTNGDGTAVDSEGRLYVSSNPGVQVFDKTGRPLGLIPTPREVISVAFAGPDKKTLFIVGGGAEDENGQPIRQGPQRTAATIYKLPVLSQGLKDRAK